MKCPVKIQKHKTIKIINNNLMVGRKAHKLQRNFIKSKNNRTMPPHFAYNQGWNDAVYAILGDFLNKS